MRKEIKKWGRSKNLFKPRISLNVQVSNGLLLTKYNNLQLLGTLTIYLRLHWLAEKVAKCDKKKSDFQVVECVHKVSVVMELGVK